MLSHLWESLGILMIIPVTVLFVFIQKYLISGFTAGSVGTSVQVSTMTMHRIAQFFGSKLAQQ